MVDFSLSNAESSGVSNRRDRANYAAQLEKVARQRAEREQAEKDRKKAAAAEAKRLRKTDYFYSLDRSTREDGTLWGINGQTTFFQALFSHHHRFDPSRYSDSFPEIKNIEKYIPSERIIRITPVLFKKELLF